MVKLYLGIDFFIATHKFK